MKAPVRTLRIDGVKTILTPKPDDAELAATALFETMAKTEVRSERSEVREKKPKQGTPAYYKDLSDKIHAAREQERRAAMRYVAYVETKIEELKNSKIEELQSFDLSILPSLEHGLYQHQDAIEREGGELKKRWQRCLAELTVMEMESLAVSAENQETNNEENKIN
jgi:hypothetical protein